MTEIFRLLCFQCNIIADILAADTAVCDIAAGCLLAVFRNGITFFVIIVIFRFSVKDTHADGIAVTVKPRMSIRKGIIFVGMRLAAELPVNSHLVAGTAEVSFTESQNTDKTVGLGITGTDSNGTGLLLNNVNFHNNVIPVFFALQEANVNIFKIACIIDTFNTAARQGFIEYVTLLHA